MVFAIFIIYNYPTLSWSAMHIDWSSKNGTENALVVDGHSELQKIREDSYPRSFICAQAVNSEVSQ